MTASPARSRRSRAGARRSLEVRPGAAVAQSPRRQPRNVIKPVDIVSADELEAIHDASMRVLEDIGLEMVLPQAREIFAAAGARVDGDMVYIGRDIIEQAIKTAPRRFTLHARNPDNDLIIGDDWMAFGAISSPPNCADLEGGRRPGNRDDFRKFVKLSQYFNCVHFIGGYPVEPIDLHPSTRHLVALRDIALLCDKPSHAYSLGRERIHDGMEIARIARGIDRETFAREPSLLTIINTNSPLKLDGPMLEGIIEMATHGQVVCVTPFTLAGAMAPVTVAGAIVEQNAEALAGIALAQLVRPGAPVIYGGFTSNVDMKSGAPAFGTPEYMKSVIVGGQLCRRYAIPYRTSNTCAANAVDAQAAYESVFSLWAVTMGHGNLVKHAAGWMEGGLVASFEKFILDCDLLQMVQEFLTPLDTSQEAFALEAIADVGPGGHFFGTAHTLERYDSAFYQPILSDWRNHEQWLAAGAPEAKDKAHQVWKQALADYQRPPMDPAIEEELNDFVDRRIAEGGIKTDF